ncbi:MAG: peptidylprolyl isomerase fpr4 [Phylliscum demangeonii]|nr:MAG: peptidylprolyl isomerase fpr4 [Phylliscum demangeonii]
MSPHYPVEVFGMKVPPGNVAIRTPTDYTSNIHITMAAIDPSAEPELGDANGSADSPKATLKILCQFRDYDDDSSDEGTVHVDAFKGLGNLSDEDEDRNGGPSDRAKATKGKNQKGIAHLQKAGDKEDDQKPVGSPVLNGPNAALSKKALGKAKATEAPDDSDSDAQEDSDIHEFVVCTLDPIRNYQQPLNITVGDGEKIFFKVSGTHTVFLTGNYTVLAQEYDRLSDYPPNDDEDLNLSPDEDELSYGDQSDGLDDLADPRIMELGTDDEEVPKLVKDQDAKAPKEQPTGKAKGKRGQNKRPAEDEGDHPSSLDDIMAKALKPADGAKTDEASVQPKLSKKQLKKLKNNAGQPVPSQAQESVSKGDSKAASSGVPGTKSSDKKVQFAKDIQGAAPDKADKNGAPTKNETEGQIKLKKPRDVKGVTVIDNKLGTGRQAKIGDTVSMRYIGKLHSNNMQFDANKSGPPFKFKLGAGEVIKGWEIGVAGMAARGERKLIIPPHLAYGNNSPDRIPRNSTLVFEVKLISIE